MTDQHETPDFPSPYQRLVENLQEALDDATLLNEHSLEKVLESLNAANFQYTLISDVHDGKMIYQITVGPDKEGRLLHNSSYGSPRYAANKLWDYICANDIMAMTVADPPEPTPIRPDVRTEPRTDWDAVEAMTDEQNRQNALSDPDTVILTPEQRSRLRRANPYPTVKSPSNILVRTPSPNPARDGTDE